MDNRLIFLVFLLNYNKYLININKTKKENRKEKRGKLN